jgi:hypothetical protein
VRLVGSCGRCKTDKIAPGPAIHDSMSVNLEKQTQNMTFQGDWGKGRKETGWFILDKGEVSLTKENRDADATLLACRLSWGRGKL